MSRFIGQSSLWPKRSSSVRKKLGEQASCLFLYFGHSPFLTSRHTLSRSIASAGAAGRDWSSVYRLFERGRVDTGELFRIVSEEALRALPAGAPTIAFIDDTLFKKSGPQVFGTGWKRDPLGPKFTINLVWAQRFMQISIAYPEAEGRCRGIPVSLTHCPVPKKPGRRATQEELAQYAECRKENRLPKRASETLATFQSAVPGRKLIIADDGGYTNSTVCRSILPGNAFVGRIRKDANPTAYPKWRSKKTVWRSSTANFLSAFRTESLISAAQKSGFMTSAARDTKPLLFGTDWTAASYAATN